MQEDFQLFDLLFEELKGYMAEIKALVAAKVAQAEEDEELDSQGYEEMSKDAYSGVFPHQQQLAERMNLIKDLARCGSFKITKEHMKLMWDVLTTDNLLAKDHQAFYEWLRKVTDDVLKGGDSIMLKEDLISLFKEKINSEETDFKHLSIEGYYWIQTFFVLANKQARRLLVLDDEEKAPPASSSTSAATGTADKGAASAKTVSFADEKAPAKKETGESSGKQYTSFSSEIGANYQEFSWNKKDQKEPAERPVYGPVPPPKKGALASGSSEAKKDSTVKEEVDVVVRVPPDQMEGINGLWRIAFESQLEKVSQAVMRLLLQLHADVDFGADGAEQKDQVPIFEDQFIGSCFKKIQEDLAAVPAPEWRITKSLTFLKLLIQNSESGGTHNLTPHSALSPGDPVTLKVKNLYHSQAHGTGYSKEV